MRARVKRASVVEGAGVARAFVVPADAEVLLCGLFGGGGGGGAVVQDAGGDFAAIDEDADPVGVRTQKLLAVGAFESEGDVAPLVGGEVGACGAHDHVVGGEALAGAELEFAVDEAELGAGAVADGGHVFAVVDGGEERDVFVAGLGFEPGGED